MNTKLHIALGAFLGIALLVVALPISSAAPPSPLTVLASSQDHQERGERTHVKQGEEVGKRVKHLQKFNKNVGAALEKFEQNERRTQNGHKPKHNASFSATIDPDSGAPQGSTENDGYSDEFFSQGCLRVSTRAGLFNLWSRAHIYTELRNR